MNLGRVAAWVCLVCACGPVDYVGTLVDAGGGSTPVVHAGDHDAQPVASPDARDASQPAQSQADSAPADAAVPPADAARAPDRKPTVSGQPAADGCSVLSNTGPCSRDRAAAFRHVLCACGDVTGPSGLDVRAVQGEACGPVGVNGNFAVALVPRGIPEGMPGEPPRDMRAGNPGPAAMPSAVSIGGDLEVGGALAIAGNVRVLGDVWSQAPPIGTGMLQVDGDLHTSDPALMPGPNLTVAGMQRSDAHTKVTPCACDNASRLDIGGLVTAAAQRNDNAAAALALDALAEVVGAKQLELECGRYFLRTVSVLGELTLRVRGHVLLFVETDFGVLGETRVDLADGAELDLFVARNLTLGASARFADAQHAGRSRVYVGGLLSLGMQWFNAWPARGGMNAQPATQLPAVQAPASFALVGNVYAPSTVLQVTTPSDVVGSMFVGGLLLLQDLALHSALPVAGGSCGF